MLPWINSHGDIVIAAYFLLSAIVSGMPEPVGTSSVGYKWAFHSLHVLTGDLSRLVSPKIPPAQS